MATPSAGDPVRDDAAHPLPTTWRGERSRGSRPSRGASVGLTSLAGHGVARAWPALVLLALPLVFFWKIAFTGQVLVGYDTFAYFYPYLSAASQALREFRLPLWNPDVFMGAPLAANLQTALFYPSTLLYLLLPAPFALSADIILHTFLAAAFTYLLARRALSVSPLAGLTAAVTFAYSGFFAAQSGHVNQLRAAVWLPLLLLFFDRALQRSSLVYTLAGSVVIALTLLAGHSQEAYMIFCALGGYFVWNSAGATRRALRLGEPPGRTLGRSVGMAARMLGRAIQANARGAAILAAAVATGAALAAVQLLPSLELARLSVRAGGMTYRQAVSFSLSPLILPQALLPGYGQNPFSEYVGYVGVVGLLLAVLGAVASWRDPRSGFFSALALAGLVLALGGYTPVYIFGYALVPGFGLFRVPARWLYLYTFGMALLAGLGMDRLVSRGRRGSPSPGTGESNPISVRQPMRAFELRRFAARLAAFGIVPPLILGAAALWAAQALRLPPAAVWLAMGACAAWLVLAATLGPSGRAGQPRLWPVLALLALELFAASRGMEYDRPAPPESVSALRPAMAHLLTDTSPYRILSLSQGLFDPGDLAEMRLMMPPATAADFATASKNKEILAPNTPMLFGIESMDGYDGGILPLQRYVELQQLFMNPWQVSVDGRLRENLTEIPSAHLLSLLNVKYVITDKVRDAWVDNVYYDLGNSATISSTRPVWAAKNLAPFPTGRLGLVSHLLGGESIADGTAVASITLRDAVEAEDTYLVRAGRDTAEAVYPGPGSLPAHSQGRVISTWGDSPVAGSYLGSFTFDRGLVPTSIEVRYLVPAGRLVIRGLSQVDPRTGASQPLAVSPTGAFRLVHSGDVKVYENMEVVPRTYVVHRVQAFQTNRAVLDALKDPRFSPEESGAAVISDGKDLRPLLSLAPGGPDRVDFVSRQPERVELAASLGADGLLVLTDMGYPGWRAYVDGVETDIYRVNHAFRGVYVRSGEHRVAFVYDGEIWRWGGLLSLVAAGLVGFVLWRKSRAGKKKGAARMPRPGVEALRDGPHSAGL